MSQPSSQGDFAVKVTSDPSGATIIVAGELDLRTAPRLGQSGDVVDGREGGELTVDLGEVGFCDSAGISALVGLRQRCDQRGWTMRVVNPQAAVRRVLVDFTGLGDYLNVG